MNKELKDLKYIEKLYHKITKRIENICFKHNFCGLNELEDKLEKSHKALEIIKTKRVNVGWLLEVGNVETYNFAFPKTDRHLTQEEFDLLKEVLK